MGPMPRGVDPSKFNREMRAAQRKAEAALKREIRKAEGEINREIDRVNRENQRRADAHNRKVERENRRAVSDYNRKVDAHNRKADAHNRRVIADINRQLRAASSGPRYTESEQALADRLQHSLPHSDDREWDVFLSYARIDGADTAGALSHHLHNLGVAVWFDELTITPGTSQALQMDKGLQKARAGVVLLTQRTLPGVSGRSASWAPCLGKKR